MAVIKLCSLSLRSFPNPEADTTVIPTVTPCPQSGTNMKNKQEVHRRQNLLISVNMVLNADESKLIYGSLLHSYDVENRFSGMTNGLLCHELGI
jgi:hypothetical protein